jgi:phytoene dehydrogenase-like protein
VRNLTAKGVEFSWKAPLAKLHFDGSAIHAAELKGGATVRADLYVLATDPFSAAQIVARSPALEQERELRLFQPLIQDGPHKQVSFRLAFAEPIRFPRARIAVVLADSEFNLTLFAEDQVWKQDVELGENVKSLWTGTSCVSTVPGRIHGLPVTSCTKEQFLEEVEEQILNCQSLDTLIREANGGRSLRTFPILRTEVWHEWRFGPEGIQPLHPKWVTTTHTQACLPNQVTSIPNLFLAGAHTRTAADVWSIEGAVESGRRAAKGIDSRVRVMGQFKPLSLQFLSLLDDVCYGIGAPHVLDLFLGALVIVSVVIALVVGYRLM